MGYDRTMQWPPKTNVTVETDFLVLQRQPSKKKGEQQKHVNHNK